MVNKSTNEVIDTELRQVSAATHSRFEYELIPTRWCAILDRRTRAEKALIAMWSSITGRLRGNFSIFIPRPFRMQMLKISGFDGGFSFQQTYNVDFPTSRIGTS